MDIIVQKGETGMETTAVTHLFKCDVCGNIFTEDKEKEPYKCIHCSEKTSEGA